MGIRSLIHSHLSDTVFCRSSTLSQSHYTYDGIQLVPPITSPSALSCRIPFIWSSFIQSRRFIIYADLELPPGIKANHEHFGPSCCSSNHLITNFSPMIFSIVGCYCRYYEIHSSSIWCECYFKFLRHLKQCYDHSSCRCDTYRASWPFSCLFLPWRLRASRPS